MFKSYSLSEQPPVKKRSGMISNQIYRLRGVVLYCTLGILHSTESIQVVQSFT